MKGVERKTAGGATSAFESAASTSPHQRTSISPLTLWLTPEERVRLEELATGMTLSAYERACVFAESSKLRKTRPKDVTETKR